MESQYISTVIAAGFAVALAHAAIPTHWLPFVLAGRAQRWSRTRVVAVVAVAGGAHVLFTTLLGALIVWFGIEVSEDAGAVILQIAGGVLIATGGYYIWRHLSGSKHAHHHSLSRLWDRGTHEHVTSDGSHHPAHRHRTDQMAVLSLVSMLTFSPCESFLPVYLSGVPYGWSGFVLLSGTLAVATLGSMIALTWLTATGLERIRLGWLDRYENLIVGSLLLILGITVLVIEI
jgi:hypothetical protein